MDEERHESFYAPKKLFKKRIRESSESDDWTVFNSFLDSPSSIYSNFNEGSQGLSSFHVNGIEDSSDISVSKLLNGSVLHELPEYTNLRPPEKNRVDYVKAVNDGNGAENSNGKRLFQLNDIDTSFIKTEAEDYSSYGGSHELNGYDSCARPLDFIAPQGHVLNLTKNSPLDKQITGQQSDNEVVRKKILDKQSPFVKKFSLHEPSKDHPIVKPIHISNITKSENLNGLLRFKLTDMMETKTDSRAGITLDHMPQTKPFQNHVSSTNFSFDSGSDSPSETIIDEDLNNLIESEILKTSYPHDSGNVDAVSSSDSKVNADNSDIPQKKQGKKWMKGDMVCQVCGDKAAGFYCGAFACEACKKFFMRSCRNDKTKYVCLRDKKCQITAESRVQCQYCRLQKCLSLNMYSPGSDVRKENVGDIPCRVCGAPSSGFHFGALTCEGCKGFFRRMAKERELGKYRCSKSGACEINTSTRNLCKSCRYKKCIDAGMSIEGSRIGRQPNAVKYAISLEVKNQSGTKAENDDKGGFTLEEFSTAVARTDFDSPESIQTKRPVTKNTDVADGFSPPPKMAKPMPPQPSLNFQDMVKWIKECDKDLKVIQTPKKESEKNLLLLTSVSDIWDEIVKPFYYHSSVIIRFAKKCQPFRKLALEDQVRMLQLALYPIVVLNHSRYYVLETKQYSYFGWSVLEREHIWKYFPFYRVLGEHFANTGDNVKLLGLDDDEFTILSTLILLNPDVPGLVDKEKVRQLQAEVLDYLEYYLSIHYPDQHSRYGLILVRLSELNFYAFQHLEGIQEMLRVYPFLSMPQLYREMFINV